MATVSMDCRERRERRGGKEESRVKRRGMEREKPHKDASSSTARDGTAQQSGEAGRARWAVGCAGASPEGTHATWVPTGGQPAARHDMTTKSSVLKGPSAGLRALHCTADGMDNLTAGAAAHGRLKTFRLRALWAAPQRCAEGQQWSHPLHWLHLGSLDRSLVHGCNHGCTHIACVARQQLHQSVSIVDHLPSVQRAQGGGGASACRQEG